MTTREKLAFVEAQIRKDIPRTMELREGCYLMNHATNKVYKIINIDGDICFLVDINNYKLSLLEVTKSTAENYFKIIGHDIMLNDVLGWFAFLNSEGEEPFCYFTIDVNGNLLFDKFEESTMALYWDLSSPCLKDQSEELIKFLYNLIKE